jgi:hypothetical protein
MDRLNVSASFLITIGHGAGPEVLLLVSVTNPDGSPTKLVLPERNDDDCPIKVFVGLSAGFGTAAFPCKITDVETVYPPPPEFIGVTTGFIGVTIELALSDLGELHELGPSVFGVIVDTGSARGQALASSTGVAQVAKVG